MNEIWKEQGIPSFITRIGLHAGEAIVGNIGSNERLNYTAIGDTINYTSRLENANKLYGTQIIVSSEMYQLIKNQFILRKIDRITVRGRTQISEIYELLAENKSELNFDIDTYNQYFDKAFAAYQTEKWDEAITLFNECLTIYPADQVAPLFIKRCLKFQ